MAKVKNYARINSYGQLLVPIELLDKIASEGYIVSTSYGEGSTEVISEIKKIDKVSIHDQDEVDAAFAQMALQGD